MIKRSFFAVGIIAMACIGYLIVSEETQNYEKDLLMSNVEALTREDQPKTKCSKETYIPDEALRSKTCLNGGTHLVCKDEDGVCCDPSGQTDCSPVIGGGKK